MNNRNIIVVDVETSGLNAEQGHEITQLAAIALEPTSFEEIPNSEFQIFLKPQFPEKASPQAIEIAKGSWEKAMAEGIDPKTGLKSFNEWCRKWNVTKKPWSKPFWSGWNTQFDLDMVKYWLKYYKVVNDYEFEFGNPIDTMALSFGLFESKVKSYKLDTIAEVLGMKREMSSHDALEDVRMTAIIFRREMLFLRRAASRMKVQQTE